MSFIETLLTGNNEKERKNKAACAAAIVITAILLVIAIIAFSICQIIDSTPAGPNDADDLDREIEVEPKEFGDEKVKEGLLVTLDDDHPYLIRITPANLQNRDDRPKTSEKDENGNPVNAYTVQGRTNSTLATTEETGKELNKMLTAFYSAVKDDNLIIENAYDTAKEGTQDAIFSAGTAVEFKYFSRDEDGKFIRNPIVGVATYKWLYNNAHKYGFVAISSDSNIFRYVGVPFATAIKTSGLSFDAFIAKLKSATWENPVFLDSNKNYATYYCPINEVVVPTNYHWTTDGDNAGGVYVTVNFTAPIN